MAKIDWKEGAAGGKIEVERGRQPFKEGSLFRLFGRKRSALQRDGIDKQVKSGARTSEKKGIFTA